jgi:hypothetical protein
MDQILVSPFDNFFLFTIESQMNGMRVATDLSVYREAYLTFKDNEEYAVRTKSSPLFGKDSAKQGEVDFTVLSYDAQQARKIKQKSFLISVIRDYPDGTSDETVIYTGTWDLFEKSAELEYATASVGIEEKIQANITNIEALTAEKVTLEAEIAALEEIIASKEAEKSSLETTLNANLAKLSSLKTSGRTSEGLAQPGQGAQSMESPSESTVEKGVKANTVPVATVNQGRTPTEVMAAQRRGVWRGLIINESTNNNFK